MQMFSISFLPETGFNVSSGHALVDMFIVLGVLLLVCLGLFLLVSFVKGRNSKSQTPHRRKHSKSHSSSIRVASSTAVDGEDGKQRRKFRKRKKDHRPRNPTLAETGGLPNDPPNAAQSKADSAQ